MDDINVSNEELRSFHSIDRDLYTRLVVQLRRDPAQALRIMAFWLMLEQLGCPGICLTLRNLSIIAIDALFEEALAIFDCIQSDTPPLPKGNDAITRTYHLTNKQVSLQYLYERRVDVLNRISINIARVCARVLDDIINKAVEETGRSQESVGQIIGMSGSGSTPAGTGKLNIHALPFIPHSLHPAFHPSLHFEVGESSNQGASEPPQDRTMFMTFSRGYPISEEELRRHLTRSYGNVVEQIHMEETRENVQALYARVVFRSSSAVNQVLNGRDRIKLVINGKHVWTRRYTERP